ncbi:hypothetical protein GCM10023189_50980 [Nibrella saemangeumensis]|uniref:TspO and MBR related proteins n=1 Tax=Nibrella saemangeumensis TaxID=1084526 RepID=A0ABP8NL69_9BACT
MTNRTLGTLGMLGAPFLGIEYIIQANAGTQDMRLAALFGIPYALGWLGCIWALYRMDAAGSSRIGRGILTVMLVLLSLANVWDFYAAVYPSAGDLLYRITDLSWPASNLFMLAVGVAVIRAGRLSGWRKYVPFAVGLWLPLSVLSGVLLGQGAMAAVVFSALYSAVMWTLLGYAIRTTEEPYSLSVNS